MGNPFRRLGNRLKKKFKPGIDPERRVGPADRRIEQTKPIVKEPRRGWSPGKTEIYKRIDPVTGDKTLSPDERIRKKGRRKEDK